LRPSSTICCLSLAATLTAGCYMPAPMDMGRPGGEGPGHRSQPLALTPAEELKLGLQANRKVLAEYQEKVLPADASFAVRAHEVLDRLIAAEELKPLRREINLRLRGYQFPWEVHVVRDGKVNAFCLPAGKMIVFTGLMRVVANDDQLATVLGHEMAHALAHHASERIAIENQEGRGGLSILRNMRYERDQESEADHIGLFLMTFAGYNPAEALRFWIRMQQLSANAGNLPEILSDHPSDARRIQDLRRWIPQALAAKHAYDEGQIAPERAAQHGALIVRGPAP
jgi:predicted Zn-dependent protease